MTSKIYVLTRTAERDLSQILRYTKKAWGKEQARRYASQLKESLNSLCEKPNVAGIFFNDGNVRFIKSGKHFIFFRYVAEQIQVLRILHEQMDHSRHVDFKITSDGLDG